MNMTTQERLDFLDQVVCKMWPKFRSADCNALKKVWHNALTNLDWGMAEDAIGELYATKTAYEGSEPNLGRFRAIVAKLKSEKRGTYTAQAGIPEATVFVMCTVSGQGVLAGECHAVHVPPLNGQHTEQFLVDSGHLWIGGDPDDPTKPGLKKFYGGEWEVFKGTNWTKMNELRAKYSANNPKPKHKGDLAMSLPKKVVPKSQPPPAEVDEFDAYMNDEKWES